MIKGEGYKLPLISLYHADSRARRPGAWNRNGARVGQ